MTHTVHLHLEETDNLALQRLCGSFDNNLDLLAKALDIHISRRFEHFTFNGAFAHAGKRALLKLLETGADARPKRRGHQACPTVGSPNRKMPVHQEKKP
uniref:Putative ATP-binding protein in pho regulon n=1 Tax=Neisseria meningitidis alpha275 TaxID=295996 RepID=C6SNI5_NEIME|nr:putative ATP-binding protein in pho regulon [Neisseria meningitidis alpha275]